MKVSEFMEMFTSPETQHFQIYNNELEEVVFSGYMCELVEELENAEITSIDNLSSADIVLNADVDVDF